MGDGVPPVRQPPRRVCRGLGRLLCGRAPRRPRPGIPVRRSRPPVDARVVGPTGAAGSVHSGGLGGGPPTVGSPGGGITGWRAVFAGTAGTIYAATPLAPAP